MRDTPTIGRLREMMIDKPTYSKILQYLWQLYDDFFGKIMDDALDWVRPAKVAAFAEPMQLLRYRSGLTGGCADRTV